MSNMPGHYHAEGDPADTVRYWDGNQWVGEPMPAPPSARAAAVPPPPPDAPASGGATTAENSRFGTVGIRIGASILDVLIFGFASLVIVEALGGGLGAGAIVTVLGYAVGVGFVAQLGGTPGKLIVGLRVADSTGTTSPPELSAAAMRGAPGLIGVIPLLGGLVIIGVVIACIVMVATDDERRSVYDRIGSTRVVYKARL